MKSKKGVETFTIVVTMVLLLVFVVVIIQFYFGGFRKIFSGLGTQIDSQQQDHDNDGVPDFADKCPCPPMSGTVENDGCPAGHKPRGNEDRTCLTKK